MTQRQLQNLKKKYIREGYKMGLKSGSKKMLRESRGIDASEIGEVIDVQAYDLSVLKNYVEGIAEKTDYNKIVYFNSEATIDRQGKSKYSYVCNIDTENKNLVIDRVSFRSENSRLYITLSFNLSHPNGRRASEENNRAIVLNMMKGLNFGDVVRKINAVNNEYS